ncbi:MAG: PfkB family carbohydrate kinase [Victivallaceae bacterium]|nr:PfkB family carbohydrate kinase [Victivallaceae bacterium]
MVSALDLIQKFPRCRIAVLGDVMLDVYLWGQVTRISPEAPVPVVNVIRRTTCPGGAANVMRNIATLGARAVAFGACGADAAGGLLEDELKKLGVDTSFLVRTPARCTTEKRRIVAGNQQLMRVDYEDASPIGEEVRAAVIEPLLRQIRERAVDAVIFEDYAKGLLSTEMVAEIVAAARENGIITALDPKPGRLAPVPGITVMKPNRSEAFALAKIAETIPSGAPEADENLKKVAAVIAEKWAPEQLLISLASQGMALFSHNGVDVIPTRAREVYDVSGAGDTVISVYTLALASGASPCVAAELANRAAGVVVGKVGTAPIFAEELRAEMENLR